MDKKALIQALRDTAQSASNSIAGTVSAPVDVTAWALRKSGMDIKKPVGGEEWMEDVGLTAPVQKGYPKMIGEVIGGIAPLAFAKGVK
jgi:hypothetical protein